MNNINQSVIDAFLGGWKTYQEYGDDKDACDYFMAQYLEEGDNMGEVQELIDCLKEYCNNELKKAKIGAENESTHTTQDINMLVPRYLSKLYYRSLAVLSKQGK